MPGHTPGKLRLSPLHDQQLYMNDGAIGLVAGEVSGDRKRVALVDLQCKAKRGEGYRTKCPERDANAARFVLTWNSHDALIGLANRVVEIFGPMQEKGQNGHTFELLLKQARAALE